MSDEVISISKNVERKKFPTFYLLSKRTVRINRRQRRRPSRRLGWSLRKSQGGISGVAQG